MAPYDKPVVNLQRQKNLERSSCIQVKRKCIVMSEIDAGELQDIGSIEPLRAF